MSWIKLHRDITDWKYWTDLKSIKVWMTMLVEANFYENFFEGEKIERGELVFTYRTWVNKFRGTEPKITKANLERIVKNFKKSGQISTRKITDKKITIIKIINYAEYQAWETQGDNPEKTKTVTQGELGQLPSKFKTVTQTVKNTEENTETPDINETQLEMFSPQDNDSDSYQEEDPKNQDSNAAKTQTTIRIKKYKNINNTRKNTRARKNNFSEIFLSLATNVLDEINLFLKKDNRECYSMEDKIEFLDPLQEAYRQGFTKLEDYSAVLNHCFKSWRNKFYSDGIEMMSHFTPETIFKKNMGKYIRQAANLQNRPIPVPQNESEGRVSDDFSRAMEFERKMKEISDNEQQEIENENKQKLDEHIQELENEEKLFDEGKVMSLK